MIGKRRDLADDSVFPEPSEYGKRHDGTWYGCLPFPVNADGFPLVANLSNHQVTEHTDGTISVYPSILSYGSGGAVWHGYLTRGEWDELESSQ